MKKNFSKWGREIWYDICIIARRWCTLVGTYEILFYKYIKNLRVSRKSLPKRGDTLRKYPSAEREKIKKRRTLLVATLTSSLYAYYADLNSEEQLKELKIGCLIQSRFRSVRSHPFPPPFFPLSSKLSFASGRTISNLESRADPGRAREQRMVGVPGSRSRDTASIRSLKPLVVRPVLRFRSTIKLISAFYSIGMYKGGWTDYFLVPALDCRESRTHFFSRIHTHVHTCTRIGVYCAAPRCIFLELKRRTEGHVVVHRCTHDDRRYATTATKSSPRDGERKKGRSNLSLTIAAFCRYVLPYNAAISKSNLSFSLSLVLFFFFSFSFHRELFYFATIHVRESPNSSAFPNFEFKRIEMIRGPFLVFRGISLQISFVRRPFSGWRRKFWKFLKVTWWFLNFTRRESFCYGRLVSGEDSRFLISEDTLLSVRADV